MLGLNSQGFAIFLYICSESFKIAMFCFKASSYIWWIIAFWFQICLTLMIFLGYQRQPVLFDSSKKFVQLDNLLHMSFMKEFTSMCFFKDPRYKT